MSKKRIFGMGVVAAALLLQGASFGQGLPLSDIDSNLPPTRKPLTVGEKTANKQAGEKPEEKAKGPTEITALGATFDNKTHQAVFIANVVVKDPEFTVYCDKLTALLKSDKPAAAGDGPKPAKPTPASAAGDKGADSKKSDSGLEKAIAEADKGKRVTIYQEKKEADGTVNKNTGTGRKAVYEASTGDITLTGMPTVQQGFNMCIAMDESTVIVLNREGRMHVTGPHKTIIKDASAEAPR